MDQNLDSKSINAGLPTLPSLKAQDLRKTILSKITNESLGKTIEADNVPNKEADQEEEVLISDILARHEHWKQHREELKKEFDEVKVMDSPVKIDPKVFDLNPSLVSEIAQVMELDSILEEKNKLAKKLKSERLTRESSFVHHNIPSVEPQSSDAEHTPELETEQAKTITVEATQIEQDNESINVDLQSLSSVRKRTFITEPKLNLRRPFLSGDNKDFDFRRDDFITRNKMLGTEARFYDALTEPELKRVEAVMEDKTIEHDKWTPFTSEIVDNPSYIQINEKLSAISTSQLPFVVSDLTNPSSTTTIVSRGKGFHSAHFQTVMCDVDALKDIADLLKEEYAALSKIDEKLNGLTSEVENDDSDTIPKISAEMIQQLIEQCIEEQTIIMSRMQSIEEVDDTPWSQEASRPSSVRNT